MAVIKYTCPDCNATLKPANPIPAGKKIKCPKCGAVFAVPAEDGETTAKPAAKAKPAAPPPPAEPDLLGDVYGFAPEEPPKEEEKPKKKKRRDEEDEEEEEEDESPKKKKKEDDGAAWRVDRAKKSLRGPAMDAVTKPSNMILRTTFIGVFSWLAVLAIILIPVITPLDLPKDDDDKWKTKKEERKDPEVEGQIIWEWGTTDKIVLCCMAVFGLIYSGVIVVGAIKMQSLESWVWSIIGSVMAIVPFHMGGLTVLCLRFLPYIIFFIGAVMIGSLLAFLGTAAGIRSLLTLLKEDVKAGFYEKIE